MTLALIAGLRALMPPYRGRAVVHYRGDSLGNRRRRTYGPCWSRSRAIAEQHVQNWARHQPSVLLRAMIPRQAVICALRHHTESVEDEYIVDRRHLGPVTVLRRFPVTPQHTHGAGSVN
jgi:hypothetical protein